jgi:predicted HTH domain antitoxin
MKDPYEVLSQKYVEVARLRKETEALRLVIELMEEGHDSTDVATELEGQSLTLCTGTEDN